MAELFSQIKEGYMEDRTKNTNPAITAEVAGIGYCSPRAKELRDVARMELDFIQEHIKGYTENEKIFILDALNEHILDYLLENYE